MYAVHSVADEIETRGDPVLPEDLFFKDKIVTFVKLYT